MNYDALDVANYIVNYCIEKEKPVSNLKLQKLLYYVQAASLVNKREPAFVDEICAWTYGPVVEQVYHRFKIYVNNEIDRYVTAKNFQLFQIEDDDEPYVPKEIICYEDQTCINEVVDSYDDYPAIKMVKKTHLEQPWKEAYDKQEPFILKRKIEDYYEVNQDKIYGQQH